MYVYHSLLSNEMIEAIAECYKVCKYIDIPLQHINDRMLKAMHRRVDRRTTERLLQCIRDRILGVSIRTTLIAGFPGETDAEFEELTEFIEDFRFDALGVFPYSQEPDTPAGRMKNQIPGEIKEQRVEALMLAQQKVAFELADSRVGSRFDVLVDGIDEEGQVVARHVGQAPTVDSVTLIGNCNAKSGQFINVRCTERDGYDLVATPTQVSLPVMGA